MLKTETMDNVCMGCFSERPASTGACPVCGYDEAQQTMPLHHLRPRTILSGKYLLGRVIGEGGFGITYIGWDLNLDIKVAIKEYYPNGVVTREGTSTVYPYTGENIHTFDQGRARFVNEAKRLAKFYALPGIVAVKDYFQENGTAYIVMEFVEGTTLKSMLAQRGGKLPAGEVLEYIKPLIRSLQEVHRAGIIHRDISPDNMIITPEGGSKLIDFGAACVMSDGDHSLSVLLKPGFAPEEQYRTRGVQGAWTDVYALCATIYRAITGVIPDEALERMREDNLNPPRQMGVDISERVEAAIMKGLAVYQKDRFQTVMELYEALYKEPQPPALKLCDGGCGAMIPTDKKYCPACEERLRAAPKSDDLLLESIKRRFEKTSKTEKTGKTEKKSTLPTALPVSGKSLAAAAAGLCLVFLVFFAAKGLMGTLGDPQQTMGSSSGYSSPEQAAPEAYSPQSTGTTPLQDSGHGYGKIIDHSTSAHIAVHAAPSPVVGSGWLVDWNELKPAIESIYPNVTVDVSYITDIVFATDWLEAKISAGDAPDIFYIPMRTMIDFARNGGLYSFEDLSDMQFIKFMSDEELDAASFDGSVYLMPDSNLSGGYAINTYSQNVALLKQILGELAAVSPEVQNQNGSSAQEAHATEQMRGNTVGNIVNGGKVAKSGDWIYYANDNDYSRIYKMRTDGSGKTMLNRNGGSNCINVVGDWVYFCIPTKGILKMRTDGTGEVQVCPDSAQFVSVVDDWIYYSSVIGDNIGPRFLFKIRTDGTEKTQIASEKSGRFNVVDGWIYYINEGDSERIYKIRTDGTEKTKLNDGSSWSVNVVDGWIYYNDGNNRNYLYKMRTDGTEKTLLDDNTVNYVNVSDGWVYYSNWDNNYWLYKMRTDGTGKTIVNEEPTTWIHVVGDLIHYNYSNTHNCWIRTDGTEKQRVT